MFHHDYYDLIALFLLINPFLNGTSSLSIKIYVFCNLILGALPIPLVKPNPYNVILVSTSISVVCSSIARTFELGTIGDFNMNNAMSFCTFERSKSGCNRICFISRSSNGDVNRLLLPYRIR
ncbi:hypothetical protein BLOT_007594 [Blomia tropicalis]|nr:hypothetical protein BLOT_007594 [Blomia tropicalis]